MDPNLAGANAARISRRQFDANIWLTRPAKSDPTNLLVQELRPEILESEADVGRAMLAELEAAAHQKSGDLVIILLGGRGAQAFHRLLGERARAGEDHLLRRLHVFTQDALAPMRMDNSLSFVRDFERLLGPEFFRQVKSFTPIRTDVPNLENELIAYVDKLEALGGIDIFFLGHGPEPDNASHLAYIILTLGPAAISSAKRIVQSIVDADTAPAKKASYRRVLETRIASDAKTRACQLDENPGLWIRFTLQCKIVDLA